LLKKPPLGCGAGEAVASRTGVCTPSSAVIANGLNSGAVNRIRPPALLLMAVPFTMPGLAL
jgi:hypothetical protein